MCVSFVDRERERERTGSQIRYNGHEYETVQAVQCCRKAAYCAFNTPRIIAIPTTFRSQCERSI